MNQQKMKYAKMINLEKELELSIVNLFQFINSLGHYTDHAWFMELNAE